jgi:putative membrane protein
VRFALPHLGTNERARSTRSKLTVKHQATARVLSALVAAAGVAAATFAVSAQPAPGPGGPPGGPGVRMPTSDAEFVRALDAANTAELDQAKYVVNRTKDPAVHQFAQHMIDDHSTAAVKLEAATRGTNLRPAPRDDGSMPRGGARILTMLQSETGTQLDNDYMRIQVPAHRRALALLQWESQNGTNANLKTLATNLIPTVQQHLQIAQNFLAAHNLTPFTPPDVLPVPGNVNPGNRAGAGPGVPNNPASVPNGGSTSGQGNATGGTNPSAPVTGPTYQPLGSGTPPPGAGPTTAPSPVSSASPHP